MKSKITEYNIIPIENQGGVIQMNTIEISGKKILINGKAEQIRSGSMHYFRIPKDYWEDRLIKLKQCGLNAVETYLAWNLHEAEEGCFNFSNGLDFEQFVLQAQKLGLMVLVRPGPYICSEWDFGGLPAWLLNKPGMKIRCMNDIYIAAADRYLRRILPKLAALQWTNGGPVIMMQIENEYGSVANDRNYLRHLYRLFRENGIDVPLFISDWGSESVMHNGSIPETLLTANCRNHPGTYLDILQKIRPDTPEIIMELWSGVSHRWGVPWREHDSKEVAQDVEELLKRNASFNFYMFHGGTSFGFMPGALPAGPDRLEPFLNSYDTDAPLDEAGNPTEKYFTIQHLIKTYHPEAFTGTPKKAPLHAFGSFSFSHYAPLFDVLDTISKKHLSTTPEFMESFGQNHGLILYRTRIDGPESKTMLRIHPADRALVYSNRKLVGLADQDHTEEIVVDAGTLDILVENMGRPNAGGILRHDAYRKGLDQAKAGGRTLFGWEIHPLPLQDLSGLKFKPGAPGKGDGPVFFRTEVNIENPADTYIRIPYGTKGIVFLNGFNLGRYWNIGPQFALYAPAPYFKKGKNELMILELQGLRENVVELIDHPDHEPSFRLVP